MFSEFQENAQTVSKYRIISKVSNRDQVTKSTYNVPQMVQSKEKCGHLFKKISTTFHGRKTNWRP